MSGTVLVPASRVSKSGSHAHSFSIGQDRFTFFSEHSLHPVMAGDIISFEYDIRNLRSGSKMQYFAADERTLQVLTPAGIGHQVQGFVYVMSNESMPGILKIGFTAGKPEDRAAELSRVTGIPTEFRLEWVLSVIGNPKAVEQRAHAILAPYRHRKEFFKVSLSQARDACSRSFAELYPEAAANMGSAFSERAALMEERRQKLAEIKKRNDVERSKFEEAEAFRKSPEGRWRFQGNTTLYLQKFDDSKARGGPTILQRLFRVKCENHVELITKLEYFKTGMKWSVVASGISEGTRVYEHAYFDDAESAISHLEHRMAKYPFANRSISIAIPNRLVDNPPPLDNDLSNTRLNIEVVRDFIAQLSVRQTPVPDRGTRHTRGDLQLPPPHEQY